MPQRLTGATLRAAIDAPFIEPQPYIEDLLYDDGAFMLCADPEAGKSVIALQMAMALSHGGLLFGRFKIPTPRKVYFCQFERPPKESLYRMKLMEQRLPFNPDNFCLDTLEGLNVLNPAHQTFLINRIKEWGQPAVVVLDPIYAMITGGLSKDEPATAISRFSTLLMRTFTCINLLTHHTHRPQYQNGVKVEEEDPFYGSQWIKAHVTTSYHLKSLDPRYHSKVVLDLKKSSNRNVRSRIVLNFDPESFTSYMAPEESTIPVLDRLIVLLRAYQLAQKTTDFYEVLGELKCSSKQLRRLMEHPEVLEIVRFERKASERTLWIPR